MQYFSPVIDLGEELWTPSFRLGCEYKALTPLASQVNLAYTILYSGIFRVAWMGEESGILTVRKAHSDIDKQVFDRFLDAAKREPTITPGNSSFHLTKNRNADILAWRKDKFLLNYSKKSYVPLNRYAKAYRSVDILPYMTIVTSHDLMFIDTMLPYNGSWAFDVLTVSTSVPDGFLEHLVGEY